MARRLSLWIGGAALAVFAVACAQKDAGITTKVKAKIESDRSVSSAATIRIETSKRVVTLTGKTASDAEKQRVVTIVKSTDGVKDVVDNLAVDPTIAPAPASTDTASPGAAPANAPAASVTEGGAANPVNPPPPVAPTSGPAR